MHTFCFDLDGVLYKNSALIGEDIDNWTEEQWDKYFSEIEIDEKFAEMIRSLKQEGNIIKIYTARPVKRTRETVLSLEKNNIPYDYIMFNKPTADFYIDDKAVFHRGNFEETQSILARYCAC